MSMCTSRMRGVSFSLWLFFFQAEDGIRDLTVTGVQTCALPIFPLLVIQVPNKTKDSDMARWLEVIYEEWPGLADDAVANVFGEHNALTLGHFTDRKSVVRERG